MSFILKSCKNHVRLIKINRPERKNALCFEMYQEISEILNEDAVDDNIVVTIITGSGEYFSSGNDMQNAMNASIALGDHLNSYKKMIDSFIKYPKLLIAVINGPAIGIGATMPAVCDIIYASNKAYFDTPFVKLGLCLEGASSFTFLYTLGRSKMSEMVYLNHKLSAEEAYQLGLISEIIPQSQIDHFIEKLHKHGNLPLKSIMFNKKIIMANLENILRECNERESEGVYECVTSPSFVEHVMNHMQNRSKQKSKL